jgi:hypothetical protein
MSALVARGLVRPVEILLEIEAMHPNQTGANRENGGKNSVLSVRFRLA